MISTTFTKEQIDNAIVGDYKGCYVVKNDYGELFLTEKAPDNLISYGETIPTEDLISISTLSESEQQLLKEKYADSEV